MKGVSQRRSSIYMYIKYVMILFFYYKFWENLIVGWVLETGIEIGQPILPYDEELFGKINKKK